MRDWQSQAHVKHYCRYHIVFVPKYRKKTIYGVLRKEIASYLPNIRLIITDVVVEDTAIDLYVAIDRAAVVLDGQYGVKSTEGKLHLEIAARLFLAKRNNNT